MSVYYTKLMMASVGSDKVFMKSYFDKKFFWFTAECSIIKGLLINGFNNLLRAKWDPIEYDYKFFLAFYQVSQGLERINKIAIICNHMLENNYLLPPKDKIKGLSHNLAKTYKSATGNDLTDKYKIVKFLSDFNSQGRYENLNKLTSNEEGVSILIEWSDICEEVYQGNRTVRGLEQDYKDIIQQSDEIFPLLTDFNQKLQMNVFLNQKITIEKSASLIIWEIIKLFKPIYDDLDNINVKSYAYEMSESNKGSQMVIPVFSEFFYEIFMLSEKEALKKRWA